MKKVLSEEQKERKKQTDKKSYEKHRETTKAKRLAYYHANKDILNEKKKEYRKNNRAKINQYHNTKSANDPLYKLRHKLRMMIREGFRKHNASKSISTEQILGCTFEEFKQYLESKFEPWMNWENKGLYNGTPNYGWDIDHIKPLASSTCENDIIRLNHYTNLRPLCSYVNRYIKKHHVINSK